MTRLRAVLGALLVVSGVLAPPSACGAQATSLQLDEVFESVADHYPLLAAVLQEQVLAEARLMSKSGAFDLVVGADSKLKPLGFYQTYQGGGFLKQPTTLWGAEFFGGYRIGTGNFAIWDGGDETNEGGEFSAGVRLPILRDRSIDDRRAALRQAEIGVEAARPIIRENVIDFVRSAAFSYWGWVSTGMRVGVARRLLDVAEVRQSQLQRRVERGALPEIDLADNERLINDRQVLLINSERAFEQAGIKLSLFLRDAGGAPVVPAAGRLPSVFPPEERPRPEDLEADIQLAYEQQPLLQEFELKVQKAEVDLELAENRLLPALGVTLGGSKDVGAAVKDPDDKGPAVLEARVVFELPVQRRQARGEVATAEARLRQVKSEMRFAREKITAEVQSAMAALRAAYDQVEAARKNVELAGKLRKAEERKLMLGQSNLINVNIREVQAFDAASTLIAAQADYFLASANYRAAVGDIAASIEPQIIAEMSATDAP